MIDDVRENCTVQLIPRSEGIKPQEAIIDSDHLVMKHGKQLFNLKAMTLSYQGLVSILSIYVYIKQINKLWIEMIRPYSKLNL